ncbi:Response regulator UvrY [Stieleria neptunia]|uniref:Response regulator UvrY n=1 Tax=Stieleria neptunia TaxID=2527979 RepID=A0A518HXT0_9BACT|nr:response regulator [Stieleria neptunia]QDV45663.1 Response regulator UvrY [Stieleria neptunia]
MVHTFHDAAKLLLVEDDDVDALLFQRTLAKCTGCYELEVCATLDSAIEWILSHDCDVVLLDYSLPDSFGIEGLRKLQSRFADLPIIMLTGLDDPKASLDARESGAQDYIVKGQFHSAELDQTLLRAIQSGCGDRPGGPRSMASQSL